MEDELQSLLDKAMFQIAVRLQNELLITAPFSGGRLRTSIKVIPYGGGLIISMAEQGKFVEFGTPPHTIRAKQGKVLHWHKTKGRTQHQHPHSQAMAEDAVFAKKVDHPGSRPNPFIRTAINTKLRGIIQEEIIKAAK